MYEFKTASDVELTCDTDAASQLEVDCWSAHTQCVELHCYHEREGERERQCPTESSTVVNRKLDEPLCVCVCVTSGVKSWPGNQK